MIDNPEPKPEEEDPRYKPKIQVKDELMNFVLLTTKQLSKVENGVLKECIVLSEVDTLTHVKRMGVSYDRVVALMNNQETKKIGIAERKIARFFWSQALLHMGEPAPGPAGVVSGKAAEKEANALLKGIQNSEFSLWTGESVRYVCKGDKTLLLTPDRFMLKGKEVVDFQVFDMDSLLKVDCNGGKIVFELQGDKEASVSLTHEQAKFFVDMLHDEIRLRQGEEQPEQPDQPQEHKTPKVQEQEQEEQPKPKSSDEVPLTPSTPAVDGGNKKGLLAGSQWSTVTGHEQDVD